MKSIEINLNFKSKADFDRKIKEIRSKIVDGFQKGKGDNYYFNMNDWDNFIHKDYKPIRTEIINGKKCEIFASKV